MSIKLEKDRWRQKIKAALQGSQVESIKIQSDFSKSLSEFLKQQTGLWSAYLAKTDEMSVDEAVSLSPHLDWVYPRMQGEALEFCHGRNFVEGSWGILEPVKGSPICKINTLAGMLIPGLGFSIHGHRLGRGKGFFDRALSDFKGLKIGVCRELQLFAEELPCEQHDVIMDWIITENSWVDCNKKEVRPWKSSLQL